MNALAPSDAHIHIAPGEQFWRFGSDTARLRYAPGLAPAASTWVVVVDLRRMRIEVVFAVVAEGEAEIALSAHLRKLELRYDEPPTMDTMCAAFAGVLPEALLRKTGGASPGASTASPAAPAASVEAGSV
eukprot:c35033_g1_i1.p2 GENE.c35033_g1_i1~~c35033_g1_i1.p2  ORF type:complete len:140 (+),score=27.31 c35033_g1_i1:33-422(+)